MLYALLNSEPGECSSIAGKQADFPGHGGLPTLRAGQALATGGLASGIAASVAYWAPLGES